jgi:hypothetical protein
MNRRSINRRQSYRNYRITAIISLFIIMFILILTTKAFGSTPERFETVVVGQGDCLWNIAKEFCGEGEDVRNLISDIVRCNSIKSDYIYPGMKLKIPVN